MSEQNIATVQKIYAAFGQGDVETILSFLADDVDWAAEASSSLAPWHGVHKGKGEVPNFFIALAGATDVLEFTPLAFASNETDVMVVIRYSARAKSTGKTATMDLHHWWRFRDGKVYYYRGTEDTALTGELLARDRRDPVTVTPFAGDR